MKKLLKNIFKLYCILLSWFCIIGIFIGDAEIISKFTHLPFVCSLIIVICIYFFTLLIAFLFN